MTITIHHGEALAILRQMPKHSVDCVVTSPPYWGLRDYGVAGQIGLEQTPSAFIAALVEVFDEVFRVLRPAGTCWVNMGDSYSHGGNGARDSARWPKQDRNAGSNMRATHRKKGGGTRPKEMMGMPWRLAFALQEAGWLLRQDIIWSKPNPMPETVRDRFTKSHEYIFLLTKQPKYFWDFAAVQEPVSGTANARRASTGVGFGHGTDKQVRERDRVTSRKLAVAGSGNLIKANDKFDAAMSGMRDTRNKRSVWEVTTEACGEAHFATFPTKLIEPCILAGCPSGGTVLDPFFGAGTTAMVADRHGRHCVGIELNAEYIAIAEKRLVADSGMFGDIIIRS